MFSRKTETLIRRVQHLQGQGLAVTVFKPDLDARSPMNRLRSHSGWELAAVSVQNALGLLHRVNDADRVVAIDEAQFFDALIVDVCLELADSGKRVLISGLDLDFRGLPFGPMPQLLAHAERVYKLSGRCSVCGRRASLSQRLIDGHSAPYHDQTVLLGGAELYEQRCRRHHEVPGKPGRSLIFPADAPEFSTVLYPC